MARNAPKLLSVRFLVGSVSCCCLMLSAGRAAAQESATGEAQESEYESIAKAEADLNQALSGKTTDFDIKAYKRLKGILQRNPESDYRLRILEDLKPLEESLGQHNLQIATFYMEKCQRAKSACKGAEQRLLQIVNEYPTFSKMDEVLLRLGDLAARDEKAEDASRYLWTVVCNYPESKLSETVFGKLNQLGSSFAGCSKTTVQSTR